MSATTSTTTGRTPQLPAAQGGVLNVTQARVIRSEWTKFASLRSTIWTLLITVVLMIGIGALISAVTAANYDKMDAATRATFDPISISLGGVTFAQLSIGVLGILVISGEYATGMIRSSLTAVPRRLPVLWGKLIVFGSIAFIVSLIASTAAFLIGQALLNGDSLGVSLSASGAVRSIFGSALYLTLAGMIALSLGALLRNTAASISTFVGVFFVLPPLTQLLPDSWTTHFVQYLPSSAGEALSGTSMNATNALSPWTGFGVLCVYAVVMIALAAVRLRRTDA